MATTPTITNVTSTNILDPSGGAAPWSVATISTSTVTNPTTGYSANVESVFFYLRGATAGAYGGAIQADYVVGTNGVLAPVDQIFYQSNGAFSATYFGTEANNPFFAASGTTPVNPGYSYTQYTYAAGGSLTEVVAVDGTGRSYIGL